MKGNPSNIEMIEYHDSNWYINDKDPVSNIEYARCTSYFEEKIKHYLIGLKVYPFVESWNNEYLWCLELLEKYDVAYQHALKYKKGQNAIAELVKYFYTIDNFE